MPDTISIDWLPDWLPADWLAAPAWLPLDLVPEPYRPYVMPALLAHAALFVLLVVPAWRAFARARLGGGWALLLILPVLGLLAVAVMLAAPVLRRAGWSALWAVLMLVPAVNVVFLWAFAYAPWRGAPAAQPDQDAPSLPAPPSEHHPADLEPAGPGRASAADRWDRPAPPGFVARPIRKAVDDALRSKDDAAVVEMADVEDLPADDARAAEADTSEQPPLVADPDEFNETLIARARAAPSKEPITQPLGGGRVWVLVGSTDGDSEVRLRVFESELSKASEGLIVGRSRESDYVLDDDSVSRAHARLTLAGDSLQVEDLDSMNGTFVDGERLETGAIAELRPDTRVEFGRVGLTLAPD